MFARAFVTLFIIIDPIGTLPIFAALTGNATPASSRRVALRAVMVAACVLAVSALGGEDLFALIGIGMPAFRVSGGLLLLIIAVNMLFGAAADTQRKDRDRSLLKNADKDALPPATTPTGSSSIRAPRRSCQPPAEAEPEMEESSPLDPTADTDIEAAAGVGPSAAAAAGAGRCCSDAGKDGAATERVEVDPSVAVFPLAIPTLAGPGSITAVLMLCSEAEGIGEQLEVIAVIGIVLLITFVGYLMAPLLRKLMGESGTKVLTALMGCLLAALALQFMMDGIDKFGIERGWVVPAPPIGAAGVAVEGNHTGR